MKVKNYLKKSSEKDITLLELQNKLQAAMKECGETSEVFFQFDNNLQFVIKGINVSKCNCCDQKLPLIYGELMQ